MSKPILQIWDEASQKYVPIPAIKGKDGKDGAPGKDGKDGAPGSDYTLTADDKQEIAALVLAALPDGDEVAYG